MIHQPKYESINMVLEEVSMVLKEVSTLPQWKCLEFRVESQCLHYGRFILSPLRKDQASTIGICMRRALLGEIEETRIIHAKFDNVPHEYSMISGIEESVHEILMNLKEIVLRTHSHMDEVQDAFICTKGPKRVTAQDIISPPYVEIVNTTKHIANLRGPVDLCIELKIKRDRGYCIKSQNQSEGYPIDAVFMPVRNVNYSIHSYREESENEKQEILIFEIWTNGSLTPKEALYEASRNLIDLLLIPYIDKDNENIDMEKENTNLEEKKNPLTLPYNPLTLPYNPFTLPHIDMEEEMEEENTNDMEE